MSTLFAPGLALAYTSLVVGVHRVSVARRRQRALGYPTLHRLDWDTLLAGLLPEDGAPLPPPTPPEGGPGPRRLAHAVPEAQRSARELLCAIVSGGRVAPEAIAAAGFSGGEARWVGVLARVRSEPRGALEALGPAASVAELALREHLTLRADVNALSLEWEVFASKRRIAQALRRFPDAAPLYFVRALASAQLGWSQAVLDDLARAVYFSRQHAFYLSAVVELPFVHEARPALARACAEALEGQGG